VATTSTFKPAANGDDGMWLSSALFYNDITQAAFGNAAGVQYHMFIRFPNITIPRRAIISAAKLTFDAHQDQSGTTCSVNVYCVNSANAAAPADLAECEALSLTNPVAWSNIGAYVTDGDYDSTDIKTPVQTIINLPAWTSGNAVVVVIKNNGSSTNAIRWVHTYEAGASICPVLTITYYDQWTKKVNGVASPAKVYGVTNASGSSAIYKINTVSR
jgi:hypothetical protein